MESHMKFATLIFAFLVVVSPFSSIADTVLDDEIRDYGCARMGGMSVCKPE